MNGKDFKVDSPDPNDNYKNWEEFLFKFWYSMGCRPGYTEQKNMEIAIDHLKKRMRKGASKMKYKAKPVTIEAVQWAGNNINNIEKFCGEEWGKSVCYYDERCEPTIYIETLEGEMAARVGDYIIKGIKGEFYPCKPDIFKEKYEEI